ncbi:beta-CASP ribonuclease aCPSF1 [Methanosphaera sp. ISO3-F5]|uniref:beta-CASP ribonuclease aCPSF1 n=1 Tax=Methanosphaera sp. ISO3-F5 TaxID=1452353 RepID=UPI002B262186|nr:beta-CASP ribonuclease aCPSF1 [Methanosphaera sp. ISO3-F5]WQH65165.1 beta-CASP ribonuclease aCPSF1 [Methanosphaera sp. ISO3-F5]
MNTMIDEIKERIIERLPEKVKLAKVEFEGPEIVIYTKNPEIIKDNGSLIRDLAKDIRKRIIIRSDKSVLTEPQETITKIEEIVPVEAEITDISFDEVTNEVIIESKKPGLVIGKYGTTSREIVKQTGWAPKILRTPPVASETVQRIRLTMKRNSKERKEFLQELGKKIHREARFDNDWVRLTSLGGFREVGRSCLFLQTPNSKVILDCGVNVAGIDEKTAFPYLNVPEFNLNTLDAVIVTHAHLDHTGFVPYLYHYGYEGPTYCTTPTRDMMTLLQQDHLDISHREDKPLPFNIKDVKETIKRTITLDYGEVTDISPDIRLTLHNAGHIVGSAMAHLHIGDGKHNFVYTGDFKNEKSRLLEPSVTRFPRIESMVMESTYGGHEDVTPTRNTAEKELIKSIYGTLNNGGKVLIPVFAVGRAQEIMIVLEEYINHGILKDVPVYIDGMIWEATAIHTAHPEFLSNDLRDQIFHIGKNPFTSEVFRKVTSNEQRRKLIDSKEPCVILSTSGMLTGGNSVEYFKMLCEDEKNSIIFVGYQSEGSLGRRIQRGHKEAPLDDDGVTRLYHINLDVTTIDGFSGHSDRKQLMEYVRRLSPKPDKILVCHGDAYKALDLASSIYRSYKIETKTPMNLETTRLQ